MTSSSRARSIPMAIHAGKVGSRQLIALVNNLLLEHSHKSKGAKVDLYTRQRGQQRSLRSRQ